MIVPLKGLKVKVKRITHLLEKRYGVPRNGRAGDPLDILIETILSQNTNDRNRDRAYTALKAKFPEWEDVLRSDVRTIIRAIRSGGLAEQKAGRIKAVLRWIKDHFGRTALDGLREMDSLAIKEMLGSLKGMGPKTIHCLLLFGLNREAFPIDTHVLRVGKRLGLIPAKMSAERAHLWIAPVVPKGKSMSLHLNLIHLGKTLCRPNHPHCSECPLASECPYPCGSR